MSAGSPLWSRRSRWLAFGCLSAALLVPGALGAELQLAPGFSHLDVGGRIRYALVDDMPASDELAAFPSERFRPYGRPLAPSFGYTTQTLLVALAVKNATRQTAFVLRVGLPRHEQILLLSPDPAGGSRVQRGGAGLPFRARAVASTRPSFRVHLPPGTSELRLAIRSRDALSAGIDLHSPAHFDRQEDFENLYYGLLFASLFVIGAYNFFLYLSTRDAAYATYSLFTLSAVLYFSSLSGHSYRYLWPDATDWTMRSVLHFVGLYVFSMMLFLRTFLRLKESLTWADRCALFLQIGTPAVSLLVWLLPFGVVAQLIMLFALSGLALAMVAALTLALRRSREAYFFLVAFGTFTVGASLFTARIAGALPVNFLTVHSIEIGSVAELLLFSFALADKVRVLQQQVSARMLEIQVAYRRVGESERRYRHLVEGASDIIFSLTERMEFESMNTATYRLLGFSPADWIGRPFVDILHREDDTRSLDALLVTERLRALAKGETVSFQARWSTKRGEPRVLDVTIEPVAFEDDTLFFGRATALVTDELLPCLELESRRYRIQNYFNISELLGDRLTQRLEHFATQDAIVNVRLGLREMLINAIEHGNLGITFEEKSAAIAGGDYIEFLLKRQSDPRYRDRVVEVDFSLNSRRAVFRITDEGDGFDHREMLARSMDDLNARAAQHGRGLMLTRNYFDVLRYNAKGNKVVLIKYF